MSNCDCLGNIEDETTVAATADKKPHYFWRWGAHNHRNLHGSRNIF